jgi:NAD(P)-dependent dehydrogenase (short-subunit alcohol dehydrogenase family)
MDKFLTGKRAIVTGGTRGIGRAIAESLLAAGSAVVICGRNGTALDVAVSEMKTKHGDRIHGRVCNVANAGEVSEFFVAAEGLLGGLDVLVNNAGVGTFKSTADLTIEDWHRVLDTNLSGVFYCCHAALPSMRRQGGGYIINISSLAGKNAFAGAAAYNASKFGLNGFSEAMMLDHRFDGVRVSYIMPGSVNTDFGSPKKDTSWMIDPADIADIVTMLLQMPARTLVSRIEVRPTKPGK